MIFISKCTQISPFFLAKYTQIFNYESESNENQKSMKKIETQRYTAVSTTSQQHDLQACVVYGRTVKYAKKKLRNTEPCCTDISVKKLHKFYAFL